MVSSFPFYLSGRPSLPLQFDIYTVSQKTRHQTLGHNFTNYYPIFKKFSLMDAVVNFQQIRV